MTRAIDYTALTSPVTKQEVSAFKAESRTAGRTFGGSGGQNLAIGLTSMVVVVATVFLFSTVGSISANVGGGRTATVVLVAFFAVMLLIVGIGIAHVLGIGRWEKWMRLSRFATANDLRYLPSTSDPKYAGAIFGQGHSRVAKDHLQSITGRFVEFGNYHYTTGSGKNSRTHEWGFMALRLDRQLPHMVLDSTANNGWFGTNLPATFKKDQVLSLEGDFNTYFTLYCPGEYERDALYVFTPDLMALLIDEAAPFDVEIIDDWMFVYSSQKFDPTSAAVYQRLFRIVDTVGAKTLAQTDRYVDERVGNFASNIVAPKGKRLKKGAPVAAIVAVVIVAGFWILPRILDFTN